MWASIISMIFSGFLIFNGGGKVSNEHGNWVNIGMLIELIVAIVVGVNLISPIKLIRNSKELMLKLETESKSIADYINNIDDAVGITTSNSVYDNNNEALVLHSDKSVTVNPEDFDLYITDKNEESTAFKIVCLHKKDASKNAVYMLGTENGHPYLFQIPVQYAEQHISDWKNKDLYKVSEYAQKLYEKIGA